MGVLILDRLSIRYDEQPVIQDFSLHIDDGEMVSILGPSGAGKTTILKAIAGLLTPTGGDILLDGHSLRGLPPEKRAAVMVFQKPLLFPFLNVEQNIGFGLRMIGRPQDASRTDIESILEMTQLKGLNHRKVHELSGGQQQRVSLARALVLKPAVLLLDEPLSSLDANLRQQMRELIQEIQAQTRITTVFVTHDQAEALTISHRVALVLDGRLRQAGSPRELFHCPRDREVARFFGGRNFFQGHYTEGALHTPLGVFRLPEFNANGHLLTATIRPEDIAIVDDGSHEVEGRVVKTRFEGMANRIWIRCRDATLVVLTPAGGIRIGQTLRLRFPPQKIWVFDSV
jgi:ABC-type Fe3+/spermidine/putrescine transport system ATPase subunit